MCQVNLRINMVAKPSKFMCLNFVSAVSLLFFYLSWSERCSGSCKLHVSQLCQRTLAKLSVVPMSYCCVWEVASISEIGPRGL